MTRFATAQDLRTYLTGQTLDPGSDGPPPVPSADAEWIAQAELLLDLISADIQSAARNRIIAGSTTSLLAGTWSRDLELPRRPVVAVTSVELNGRPLAAGGYTWNDRTLIRAGSLSPAVGLDVPAGSTATWGGPASTVSVAYSYGYEAADVPQFVRSLALRIAARTIDNPSEVAQESLGPYSVSYRSTLAAGGSHVSDLERKMLRRRLASTSGTASAGSL